MKFIAVSLVILCKGLYTIDSEPCQKWICTDLKESKIVYVLDESPFDVGDTIKVTPQEWRAAKDTLN